MVEMFHALATEGNASKYFVACVRERERDDKSRWCTFYDAHFTIHVYERSVNEGINSVFSTTFVLDAEPDR